MGSNSFKSGTGEKYTRRFIPPTAKSQVSPRLPSSLRALRARFEPRAAGVGLLQGQSSLQAEQRVGTPSQPGNRFSERLRPGQAGRPEDFQLGEGNRQGPPAPRPRSSGRSGGPGLMSTQGRCSGGQSSFFSTLWKWNLGSWRLKTRGPHRSAAARLFHTRRSTTTNNPPSDRAWKTRAFRACTHSPTRPPKPWPMPCQKQPSMNSQTKPKTNVREKPKWENSVCGEASSVPHKTTSHRHTHLHPLSCLKQ